MYNILIKSSKEKEEVKALLEKRIPQYRQAYSDRTAWLMACISELAYVKFNPISKQSSKNYLIEKVSELVDENKVSSLEKLFDLVGYDPQEEKKKLEGNAKFLNLELVKTFDHNGTQAILLENNQSIFLAFRGTEPTSFKDLKTDFDAALTACESGGKIHSGFKSAFDEVFLNIAETLDDEKYRSKPLFLTGHSMGGALATIAAKELNHQGGIAACYTFGSPKVGDDFWTENIKTPIYRIVNAADPVTILPPRAPLAMLAWAFGFIPFVGKGIKKWLLSKFFGYLHAGDMRYLSNCKSGNYSDVKLLYAVSILFRIKTSYLKNTLSIRKIPADHSITMYRHKLKVIAERNNQ